MFTLLNVAAFLLFGASAWAQSGQQVRYQRVFNGITSPAVTGPVQNNGQGLHLLTCFAPTAVADVTGELIQIQASFDNVSYFPISLDMTNLPYIGSPPRAFRAFRANGSFPYVRVAALTVNPAFPLTCYYTGAPYPIGNVYLAGDRYINTSPVGAVDKASFLVCLGTGCTVEANVTNRYIVTQDERMNECFITAKSAPTGGSGLIMQLLKNGVDPVFPGAGFLLPSGAAGVTITRTFLNSSFVAGDIITANIVQVGSVSPGQDVTLSCTFVF